MNLISQPVVILLNRAIYRFYSLKKPTPHSIISYQRKSHRYFYLMSNYTYFQLKKKIKKETKISEESPTPGDRGLSYTSKFPASLNLYSSSPKTAHGLWACTERTVELCFKIFGNYSFLAQEIMRGLLRVVCIFHT